MFVVSYKWILDISKLANQILYVAYRYKIELIPLFAIILSQRGVSM